MNIQTAKLELIKLLVETEDTKVIETLIKILTPQKRKESVWGYDTKGNLITDDMMLQIIDEAKKARKQGNLISQDALETESENW